MQPEFAELSLYRLEKAKQDLKAGRILLRKEMLAQSLNRSYYAIFHSVRALLALDAFDSRKHSGIISYFNKNYIAKGIFEKDLSKILMRSERIRCQSDYNDFYILSKEDAVKQINDAEFFISKIEKFINQRLKEI